jgi:diguanylate cyclase (GGDEF)-like protein
LDGVVKIVVAEDDRGTRLLLARTLGSWGYDVVATADGQEAWEALSRDGIRMLLSDWEMPRLSGPELCRRIRQGHMPYVYALLLTSHKEPARIVDGLEAGADDFVSKPFDPAELRARLGVGRRFLGLQDDLEEKFAELERANRQLARIAAIDPLMNIGNRRSFEEAIARISKQAADEASPYAVIMIDIDHFKTINDRFGHAMGDRVLATVATALQSAKEPRDELFRYGGEEIVLVAPGRTADSARDLAETLRAAVAALRVEHHVGTSVRVTASFGVSFDAGGREWGPIVEKADRALYESKRAGRDRVTMLI